MARVRELVISLRLYIRDVKGVLLCNRFRKRTKNHTTLFKGQIIELNPVLSGRQCMAEVEQRKSEEYLIGYDLQVFTVLVSEGSRSNYSPETTVTNFGSPGVLLNLFTFSFRLNPTELK